jgi:hypothetical protein
MGYARMIGNELSSEEKEFQISECLKFSYTAGFLKFSPILQTTKLYLAVTCAVPILTKEKKFKLKIFQYKNVLQICGLPSRNDSKIKIRVNLLKFKNCSTERNIHCTITIAFTKNAPLVKYIILKIYISAALVS